MNNENLNAWREIKTGVVKSITEKKAELSLLGAEANERARKEGVTDEVKGLGVKFYDLLLAAYSDGLSAFEQAKILYPEVANLPDYIESVALIQADIEIKEKEREKYL